MYRLRSELPALRISPWICAGAIHLLVKPQLLHIPSLNQIVIRYVNLPTTWIIYVKNTLCIIVTSDNHVMVGQMTYCRTISSKILLMEQNLTLSPQEGIFAKKQIFG